MNKLKKYSSAQLVEELRRRTETQTIIENTGPEDRYIVNYTRDIHTKIPVGSILLCVSPEEQHD